ncbi:SsrA-binding protein SmpB [Alphaproteobacteria bacterium]|nr:SsrA-binding protein SmpB [Alphaproteobacteria bacterium]
MSKKKDFDVNIVAQNRKAYHNYDIQETFEAGIVLLGSEVKSLRNGLGSIGDSYAAENEGELWLRNIHIAEYSSASFSNHEPTRPRKILLKKRELNRLLGSLGRSGISIIPLKIYFNSRGTAKIALGLGKGKKLYDKREDIKKRDWQRSKARILRVK